MENSVQLYGLLCLWLRCLPCQGRDDGQKWSESPCRFPNVAVECHEFFRMEEHVQTYEWELYGLIAKTFAVGGKCVSKPPSSGAVPVD